MTFNKLWLSRLFFFLLILTLVFTGCGKKETAQETTANEEMSPKDIIIAASEAMQKIKTYSFKMNMNMNMPNPETGEAEGITMEGEGETNVDPIKCHLLLKSEMEGIEVDSEAYVVVEDNKLIEYIINPNSGQGWLKMELPMTEESMKMFNPVESLKMLKDVLLDAKIVGEEEKDKVELVVLEVTLDSKALSDMMKMFSGSDLPLEAMQEQMASMGNLVYKIWVRKTDLYITKTEMDLGQLLKSIMLTQVDEEMKGMLDQVSAIMVMEYTDYDKPVNIQVPDKVKSIAQDVSELMKQQTQ